MQLAGLQKSSLIDFPEKVSCVIFLTGCNFACPYCHNPELALGEYPDRIPGSQLLAFLEERRKLLDGVVITGGEPTLDPNLSELCRSIKALGYAVKLDTNGSRPGVLARLIHDSCVDYIAMDIKTALENYGPPLSRANICHQIEQSTRLIMDSGLDYEFRTTCVRPFVDAAAIRRIAQTLAGARQYWLQNFQPNTLLQTDFYRKQPDCAFTPQQMRHLQATAAPFVERCDVR